MIDLYILGFLGRMGPQHGYRLRQAIKKQAADFADIKLPTLYYHLANLEKRGLVVSRNETADRRPERTVYSLTPAGEKQFLKFLDEVLEEHLNFHFGLDAVFFFGNMIDVETIQHALQNRMKEINEVLAIMEEHEKETYMHLDYYGRKYAGIIFDHHAEHYRAELRWIERTIRVLNEEETGNESE